MKKPKTILTSSSLACLFTCPRKYYLSYIEGWRKRIPDDALRFGTAFHKGVESFFDGKDAVECLKAAMDTAGDVEFSAEVSAQLTALLFGYIKRWGGAKFTVKPEQEFAVKVPFARGVVLCGKMDGIVQFEDGTNGIIEHKTTSEDISPLGDYWNNINRDQIGIYKAAAESLGMAIEKIVYDVIRKPTIKQGKEETADAYGARLLADCVGAQEGDNPRQKGYKRGADFYFGRKEIPLLATDQDRLARRIYAAVKVLKLYQKIGKQFEAEGAKALEAYPKTGSGMTCRFCPFRGACESGAMDETTWERGRAHEELEIVKKFA